MKNHSEEFKQESKEAKNTNLSAFQDAIINFCETLSDIDTNKLGIQTTILDINGKSCSITINKFDEFVTYSLSYKDEDIIYFNTQLNKIKFNSTIELLDQQNYIMHIITESIRLQSKEDPKTNTIKGVQKLFGDAVNKNSKIEEETTLAIQNTNYILDQVSEITKSLGKFSEKLQSNYKVTLENHNIGNFQIVKSEYKYLEDTIELELQYNGEIIKINRKIDITNPEGSIYIGGVMYRFSSNTNTYISTQNTQIPDKYIKLLEELKIISD